MVSPAVILDAGPLGLLSHTRPTALPVACRQWLAALLAAGRRVIVPEVGDYELRRELIRLKIPRGLARLDQLGSRLEYSAIATPAMRRAAELWATVRQAGKPTAGNKELDADMILAGQALTLGVPFVVATTNLRHLRLVVPAELWQNIRRMT